MDTFKMMKLRSYFYHMVLGVIAVAAGINIVYSIIFEMFNTYQPEAKIAYLCGILACAGIVCYGAAQIYKALFFEKKVFRHLNKEEEKQVYAELSADVEMLIPRQCVVTGNYFVLPVMGNNRVHILPKNKLLACFHGDRKTETNTATEMTLVFYDTDFKSYVCEIKSKSNVERVEALYQQICREMPWIFHDDYDSFLVQSRKIGHRRKMLKQLETMKQKLRTGYSGEKAAEEEMQAMALEAEEKLTVENVKKRFFSKKSK